MFDIELRGWKDAVVRPIAVHLARWATPNQITAASLAVGLLGVACAAFGGAYGLAVVFWLASRVLDGLDGAVARAGAGTTKRVRSTPPHPHPSSPAPSHP